MLSKVRKLNIADFSKVNKDDIAKIAASINPTLDELQTLLKKGLTVEKNLPFSYIDITVTVDSGNNVTNSTSFPVNLTTSVRGLQVISAKGVSADAEVISCPFIVYEQINGIIKISKVTGLQPNKAYNLTVFIYG